MSLTKAEQRVLRTFRQFLMTPHQMLCFSAPFLQQNRAALRIMTDKDLLVQERFHGGYSLTRAGYVAMNDCRGPND